VAKAEKGGGNNLTRQHYQMATGSKPAMSHGGKVSTGSYQKGAKVASKRSKG